MAKRGYVELPEGWERVSADGPGPFVTSETLRRPDGTLAKWRSRAHRKAGHSAAVTTWMATLFALGSACFLIASVASQWASTSRPAIGVVFFIGSLLFTSAAYLQYGEVVNVHRKHGERVHPLRVRPASWEPKRIDWLASAIQLAGTVFFNISTFLAMQHGLTAKQADVRVWAPDVFGSIAFLLASALAYAEVCHRWWCVHRDSMSWWIVALNMLGSIAFGLAAIASLVEPSTDALVNTRIANAGTSVGAVCFLIGAILLVPEARRARATGP